MINIDVQVTVNGEVVKSEELNNVVAWWVRQKLVSGGAVGTFAAQPKAQPTERIRTKHHIWTPEEAAKFITEARLRLSRGVVPYTVAKELSPMFGNMSVNTLDQRIRRLSNLGQL